MLSTLSCFLTLLSCVCCTVLIYTKLTPHMVVNEFRDMPASFGGEIPLEGVRGIVIQGQPPDGCSALAPPPNVTENCMVLVARYNCDFETKVRNAQNAGYSLAIVHNVNSSSIETMSAKNAEGIFIPSVFIGDESGFDLRELYSYPKEFYVFVDSELPFDINTHLLLPFAIVVAMCFSIMFVFLIIKWIKDRRRARRHRLPSKALKKIPLCKYSKGDPYDMCAICLDDYAEGDRLRVLPCAHAYHAKCIDPWLTKNRRVCPVCKRRVVAAGERRAPGDSDSDDDRAPLLPDEPPFQGGTFDEQSVNPFVRAAALMARLRLRDASQPPITEEDVPSENSENTSEPTIVYQETERARETFAERKARRSRRHTPAVDPSTSSVTFVDPPAQGTEGGEAGEPAHPRGKSDSKRRGKKSARGARDAGGDGASASRGEIGVAAIPASINPAATPPHLNL